MSAEENKDLVRQLTMDFNALNGDVAKLRSLYEKYYLPGYIHHDPSRGDIKGEQRMQYVAMMLTAFPDISYSIDDIVAEGDKVASRYTMRVTHTETFMGIAATGKQIMAKGADMRKVRGGKVVEIWDFPDTLGIMAQLGSGPSRTAQK